MPVFNNALAGAAGSGGAAAYEIERSLRFNSADSAYLNRTPSSAGNRRTWTWAGWVKRCKSGSTHCLFFAGTSNNTLTRIIFDSDGLNLQQYDSGSQVMRVKTNALFRDHSAWYHIVAAVDTTQSTASDRVNLYVNGVLQTSLESETYPSQNLDTYASNSNLHSIGVEDAPGGSKSYFLDGYLADVHFIDGKALAPTAFGEFDDNNVWQPKKFSSFDNPNDGTTWSNALSPANGPWRNSNPKSNGFDGSSSTSIALDTVAGTLTFSPNLGSGSFEVEYKGFNDGQTTVSIDGTTLSYSGSDAIWTGTVSSFNTMTMVAAANNRAGIAYIKVNGYVLLDGANDNSFKLNFSDTSSNAALGTDSSGNNNTWTVNNLVASAPSKTLSRLRFKTDWNWMYISQININGSMLTNTQATLDTSANVWQSTSKWYSGGQAGGHETYSQSARGVWFDLTMNSGQNIANFRDLEIFMYLDSSAGSTTNVFEIELFFADGTSHTKVYPANSDAPNQANAAFNSRQWQDFGSVGLALPQDIDSLIDTPTNYEASSGNNGGNYCVLNPLDQNTATLTNGNLQADVATDGARFVRGSIAVSSGKWYWECTTLSGTAMALGVAETTGTGNLTHSQSYYYYANNGTLYGNQSGLNGSFSGSQLANGDVLGVALDMDAGTLKFYKNGSLIGTAWTGLTGKLVAPIVGNGGGASNITALNFGQRPFSISSVPTGYKSLCTQNFDDPTILNPSQSFDVLKYDGITQSPRTVTGLGVAQPDLVWVKRTNNSSAPLIWDAVRGTDKNLRTDTSDTESAVSGSANGIISNYATNGFIVKDGSGSGTNVGSSGTNPYVAWAWDCGSSNTQISVGGLNSSVYNTSSTWRNNWTASGNGFGSNPVSNIFDASVGNYMNNDAGGQYITWNTTSYTLSGQLLIDVSSSSGVYDIYVNGSKAADTSSSRGWVDCGTFADINEIQFAGTSYGTSDNLGSAGVNVYGIKVGGKQLIDSDVTPENVPSVASTVRANQSTGCSIVTYTGTQASGSTVAHGLNKAPEFWVMKSRSGSGMWVARHKDVANTHYMQWDDTANARNAVSDVTGDADATSTVIPIGAADANNSGVTHVAYCFAPVEGFSAMGKWDGTSSADGPFIYTGFRPAWIMVKNVTTSGYPWHIYDDKRDGYNFANLPLYVDLPDQQGTSSFADILSNGFKIRNSSQVVNTTGDDYIWMAFASNPFKYARAR